MKSIYCISGLGANEKVFSHLQFGDNKVTFIKWKIPEKKDEPIHEYAKRMAEEITDKNPILVGLSFGGMMSIEIAKIIPVEKVILISSIKDFHEMPLFMRIAGKLKLDKIIPLKPYKFLNRYQNYRLGVETEEQKNLVNEYRLTVNQQYMDWAIHQILNWKNEWVPDQLVHIHGGSDRIFPLKKLKANYSISSGGHMMLINNAAEVNKILKEII
ncbi:MAG: alpha/beta hydrolase [Ginsengibacter sp.]